MGLGTCLKDIKEDLNIIRNGLHMTSRFQIAMRYVSNTIVNAENGNSNNIWLTGHSLGAAIAMLAGKTTAEEGTFLETFLFNLPLVCLPIGKIKNEIVEKGVRVGRSFILAAGLAVARKAHRSSSHHHNQKQTNVSEDPLVALSEWVPHLYVHLGDQICSEYEGYFKHRKTMENIGELGVWRGWPPSIRLGISVRVLQRGRRGKKNRCTLFLQLI